MNEVWDAVLREDIRLIEQYAANENDLEVGARLRGTTLLYEALANEKYRSYKRLLELGASPNTICRGGALPIQYAAGMDDPKWLKLALEYGGDPNILNTAGSYNGKTRPIFWAVMFGHQENAILLIEAGADVDDRDDLGFPLIEVALRYGRYCAVVLLIQKGADVLAEFDGAPAFLRRVQESIPTMWGDEAASEYACYLRMREILVNKKFLEESQLPPLDKVVFDPSHSPMRTPVNRD